MNIQENNPEVVHLEEQVIVEDQTCSYSLCNPNGKYHRFLALLFMCGLGFGSYFCYDNPSALQDNIMQDINITSTKFSLLYSLYSWPPVVVCIIGGILIDSYFGIALGTIIYMGITLTGQLVFAGGALLDMFWVMALGRFIFGIGAEPLCVAQSNYAVAWFKGKELNMVFGFQQSFSGIGSVLNFWTMDPLYNWMGTFYSGYELLGIVLLIASITCVFSMVCAVILGSIHQRSESIISNENENTHTITLNDVKSFHWSFWLLNAIDITFNIAIYPFFALSKVFFMNKFNMTSEAANRLSSMLYFVSVFGAPLLGFAIDKVGRNISWLVLATTCTLAGHYILAFLSWNPYIGVVLMSIASSITSTDLYTIIATAIPNHQLGTAYGVHWSIQNLFLGTATIVSGIIVDNFGYHWLEVFFIISSAVSLMLCLLLLVINNKQNGVLNMTSLEREAHEQYQPNLIDDGH